MEQLQWSTQKRKVNDLIPYDKNPRQLTKDQAKQLTASLSKFNLVEIPAVDTDNKIVAGHQRLQIMKLLGRGEETIDVRMPNRKLTDEEFSEYNIRSNRDTGEWDWDVLANNFDFGELVDFGFEVNEIEKLFDIVKEDQFDLDDELKNIPIPMVKLGDSFTLGKHRLVCGDSTSIDDVAKLMVAERARLIFTDPPYGVNYHAGAAKGTNTSKHDVLINDELTGAKFQSFLQQSFINLFKYTTDDVSYYIWFANSTQFEFRSALENAGFQYAQILIWIKERFTLSRSDYHHCYEPCMYGWKKGKKHFVNKIRSFADIISLEDVNAFADYMDIWFQTRDNMQTYIHPTQKPVRLAERAIKMNTEAGDIVVDVFGGSGSTLMACEQLNRRCNIMELDPKFAHAILNRWHRFTGEDPVRQDGNKWSEITIQSIRDTEVDDGKNKEE